jgi:hypothetical protein
MGTGRHVFGFTNCASVMYIYVVQTADTADMTPPC